MIFILNKNSKIELGLKVKCTICEDTVKISYRPMKEWSLEGVLCGKCYSKKIAEFYPGKHIRVNKD